MFLVGFQAAAAATEAAAVPSTIGAASPRLATDLATIPVGFERNDGQFDPRVKFAARGRDDTVYFTERGAVLALSPRGATRALALRLGFAGAAQHARIQPEDLLPGRSNYLIGNEPKRWHTDVPRYQRVSYRDVYDGIDIVYYARDGKLEYDVVAAPGADLAQVRVIVEGADRVSLNEAGDLVLHTALGELIQRKPTVYQDDHGRRVPIDARYALARSANRTEVRFQVDAYDKTLALVLDPTLNFGTFFGGSANDDLSGIAVDAANDIYIAGTTTSTTPSFPTTVGAYRTTAVGSSDGFVAKIKGDGSQLLYSTYIGGTGADNVIKLAVDGGGNATVVGVSVSTNYPVMNAVQPTDPNIGQQVGIVTKLNAAGNALLFSTYLGGTVGTTFVFGVVEDGGNNTYVVGNTAGAGNNFPTTVGAFQTVYGGTSGPAGGDAFLVKYDAGGARVFSTYLGGAANDEARAVTVDASGNAYVIGDSGSSSFNGFNAGVIGPIAGFAPYIVKVNAAGSALIYLTRIGGSSGIDGGRGIAVDGAGVAYFTGYGFSFDLPTTPAMPGGIKVALVGALNAAGSALNSLTWYGFGGSGSQTNTEGTGIAIDPTRQSIFIVGFSDHPDTLPATNPVSGLGCGASCSANYGGFFLRYQANSLVVGAANATESKQLLTDPALDSATVVTGGAATSTYGLGVARDFSGNPKLGVSSNGTPPTVNANDNTANGNDDALAYGLQFFVPILPPAIAKAFQPDTIGAGGTTLLALTISNPNAAIALTNVRVGDTLPIGLRLLIVPADSGQESTNPPGCASIFRMRVAAGDNVSGATIDNTDQDNRVTLAPGFTCTLFYRIAVPTSSGAYHNVTDAPRSDQGNGQPASADLTVLNEPAAVWTGAGADNKTSNGANWQGGIAPASGANWKFPAGAAQTSVGNDLSAATVGTLDVAGTGYTLAGNALAVTHSLLLEQDASLTAPLLSAPDSTALINYAGKFASVVNRIDIAGSASFYVFNQGTATFSGPLGGLGTLVIDGPGPTRLTGSTSGFSGSIGVGDGNAQIDGNYPAPIIVGNPGILSGSGTVGAADISGVISPGSAVDLYGFLRATSLILRPPAPLPPQLAIRALAVTPGTSSRVVVTGNAALDGNVHMNFDAPPAPGSAYTVLSAGSISGRFAHAIALPPTVFGDLTYSTNVVVYSVIATDGLLRDGFE